MDKLTPPDKGILDEAVEQLKALTGLVPIYGPLIQIFLNMVATPIEQRTQNWMLTIANGIIGLDERLRSAEKQLDLATNKRFVTVFLHATPIATRNHQEDKLNALRNAVLNSIDPPPYNESLQIHFLSLIDRFTEWHLKILALFGDEKWNSSEGHGKGRKAAIMRITNAFRMFENEPQFLELILSDLRTAYLIDNFWDGTTTTMINRERSNPNITLIGKRFLTFISASG